MGNPGGSHLADFHLSLFVTRQLRLKSADFSGEARKRGHTQPSTSRGSNRKPMWNWTKTHEIDGLALVVHCHGPKLLRAGGHHTTALKDCNDSSLNESPELRVELNMTKFHDNLAVNGGRHRLRIQGQQSRVQGREDKVLPPQLSRGRLCHVVVVASSLSFPDRRVHWWGPRGRQGRGGYHAGGEDPHGTRGHGRVARKIEINEVQRCSYFKSLIFLK